jgi:hypothetical protein
MKTHRKLQIGAAVVMANGLIALSAVSPTAAVANPCATYAACFVSCPANTAQFCQSIAPSGCTVTSSSCFVSQLFPPCPGLAWVSCRYD